MNTPFDVVEPVFQELFHRVWDDRSWELDRLGPMALADSAIYATRILEGSIDNGGVISVFHNTLDHLIPVAIEGYLFLELAEHARLLSDIVASGFDGESSEALIDAFDNRWFALEDAEIVRARLISGRAARSTP